MPVPLNLRPLIDVELLAVTAAYAALLALARILGLVGLALALLALLSLWRYGYAVLRAVAQGRRRLPTPGIETMNPVGERALLLHFVFFAVLGVFLATTELLGVGALATILRMLALLALLLAFPASAALMALTRSLQAAVNPVSISSVARTLGADYVTLMLACTGLAAVAAAAATYLLPLLGGLGTLLGDVLLVWTWLALFALIGAALRAHRDDFTIPGEVKTQAEYDAERRLEARRSALDRAYASLRSGLVTQGERTIQALIDEEGGGLEIHRWLVEETLAWEDQSHARRLGQRFIELAAEARPHEALEVLKRCRHLSERFVLPEPTAAALAAYARSIGWHATADELAPPSADGSRHP